MIVAVSSADARTTAMLAALGLLAAVSAGMIVAKTWRSLVPTRRGSIAPMTATLAELMNRHAADKRIHRFGDIYEQHLAPLRHEPITLLEIGVKHGASLRMWADYFPHAQIHGIDVRRDAKQHEGDRIAVHIGHQRHKPFLEAVCEQAGPLNVVLDDGSHRYPDQEAALLALWPHLQGGGIYIVEDLHTSYMPRYGMGYRRRGSTVEMLKELVDDTQAADHDQPPTLSGVASLHFYAKTCVIVKR